MAKVDWRRSASRRKDKDNRNYRDKDYDLGDGRSNNRMIAINDRRREMYGAVKSILDSQPKRQGNPGMSGQTRPKSRPATPAPTPVTNNRPTAPVTAPRPVARPTTPKPVVVPNPTPVNKYQPGNSRNTPKPTPAPAPAPAKPTPAPAKPAPAPAPAKPNPITGFNQALMGNDGLLNQVRSYADIINGLDIAGINDQRYDNLLDRGRGFMRQYERLNPGLAESENARGDLYATTGSTLTDALARLDDLRGQRSAEIDRIQGFSKGLFGDVTSLRDTLGRVDYWDQGLDSYWDQIDDVRGQMRGFSSDLLKQVGLDPSIDRILDAQTSRLKSLEDQRAAEQQRIADYESGLLGFGDTIGGQLDGLGIADLDQINALNRQLDERMRAARGFSSKLDFDLSDELYSLTDHDLRIDELLSQRKAEEDRIKQARSGFADRATSLQDMVADADIYDADAFTDYERRLRDLRGDVTGFETPLAANFDFADQFGTVEQRLAQLRRDREAALLPYQNRLDTAATGIDGIDLWDEDALTARRRELDDILGDTYDFSGGTMRDFRGRIDQSLDLVDDRLAELGEKRTGLNADAEELLRSIQSGAYYGADDIAGRRSTANEMRSTLDKWGVRSGMDEMDAIDAFLRDEEGRLGQDADNVEARETQAQAFARAMLGGQAMGGMMGRRTLSDDEILALMQSMEDKDDFASRVARSSFSRSLGV